MGNGIIKGFVQGQQMVRQAQQDKLRKEIAMQQLERDVENDAFRKDMAMKNLDLDTRRTDASIKDREERMAIANKELDLAAQNQAISFFKDISQSTKSPLSDEMARADAWTKEFATAQSMLQEANLSGNRGLAMQAQSRLAKLQSMADKDLKSDARADKKKTVKITHSATPEGTMGVPMTEQQEAEFLSWKLANPYASEEHEQAWVQRNVFGKAVAMPAIYSPEQRVILQELEEEISRQEQALAGGDTKQGFIGFRKDRQDLLNEAREKKAELTGQPEFTGSSSKMSKEEFFSY